MDRDHGGRAYVEKTIDVPLNEKGRAIYAERTQNLQKGDPGARGRRTLHPCEFRSEEGLVQ